MLDPHIAAGLILAAGESKRMGSPKAVLDFRGETFLDRLIDSFSEFCSPVVVVVGCEAERIRRGVRRPERAVFAENAVYHCGQLSSMQCGLRMIPQTAEGVLFTLVDHLSRDQVYGVGLNSQERRHHESSSYQRA